jgi:cellulase/cellobiase CelA1
VVAGQLVKQSDWPTGYCATVKVKNTTTGTINWKTTVALEGAVNNLWNAQYTIAGKQLTAQGVEWNKTLAPQAGAEFGFCATK